MMKRRMIRTVACAACLAMVFTSCGSEVPNSSSEEVVQQEEGEEMAEQGLDSAKTLTEMLAVDEEKWTKQMNYGGNTIDIDATVFVPDVEHMQIISLESQSMGKENRKELLAKFCEQPYVLDRWNPPQWYIDVNKPWLEATEKQYNEDGTSSYGDEECAQNQIALLDAWRQKKGDTFEAQASESYEELDYYGEYAGRMYQFSFRSDDALAMRPLELGSEYGASESEVIRCMHFLPADYNGLTHFQPQSETVDYSPDVSVAEGEASGAKNACEKSVEEAEQEAMAFLEGLGYSGLVVDRINMLAWYDYVQEPYLDGYQFVFYRNVDGIALNEEKITYGCQKHGYFENDRGATETYKIYVTDAGVIAGSIQSPYLQREVVSENTRLLSYQQVKDVFESLLSKDETYYSNPNTAPTLNALRLTYGLQEDNGTYVIVPVWRLEWQDTTYDAVAQEDEIWQCSSVIMINAIDGSVIDPGDEMGEE